MEKNKQQLIQKAWDIVRGKGLATAENMIAIRKLYDEKIKGE